MLKSVVTYSGNLLSGQVSRFHHSLIAGSGNTVVFQDTPMILSPLLNPYADFANSGTPTSPGSNPVRVFGFTEVNRNRLGLVDASGLVQHVCQDSLVICRNATGALISGMCAVYISGSLGSLRPLIGLAKADSTLTMPAIGVATENIGNNTDGYVMFEGHLENFDTSAFSDGDLLYVSPTVAGGLTAVKPANPQIVAHVVKSHATQGILLVTPGDNPPAGRSGGLTSGTIFGSGALWGSLGPTSLIASGTIGTNDIGSGQIVSGLIGSGQVDTNHFASGATATNSIFGGPFFSGSAWTIITEESISGVRAVHLSQSGTLRLAMASISGRMPAIGVVVDNVLSGIRANVYRVGDFQFGSGLADYSGSLGLPLIVGRSGHIVTVSGSFNSGGLLSGDYIQQMGSVWNSGGAVIAVGTMILSGIGTPVATLSSGQVQSGQIGSGAVNGFFGPTRNINSGTVGVFDLGSGAVVAGTIGSGATQSGNIGSGQIGPNHLASGIITSGLWLSSGSVFGQIGGGPFVVASGTIDGNNIGSGAIRSGNLGSGVVGRNHLQSGIILSGVDVGSGALWGSRGPTALIASGTVAGDDLGSGAIVSGHIGDSVIIGGSISGIVRNISSGTLGPVDLASGTIFAGAGIGVTIALSGITVTNLSGGAGSTGQASGIAVTHAQDLVPFFSGSVWTITTEETISGIRAVQISPSGNLRVAMASISGRMPAIGIVWDNVLSGIQANVYTDGVCQATSGLVDFSGYLSQVLVVGRSGEVVKTSGSWCSGGFASGDQIQRVGVVRNSGSFLARIDPMFCRRASG